jgi:uncharacterized membrane-anchored protein
MSCQAVRRTLWCALLVFAIPLPRLEADPANVRWIRGPRTVDLGGSIAQVSLGDRYAFAGAEDTKKLMEVMGNTVTNTEVGLVVPQSKDEDWILVFEYKPVGYVKDDDRDKIDAGAILENIRSGTEEANAARKQRGIPGLHVVGWSEPPHYDTATHNLVWALLAKDDTGHQVVNYNVRLLGREGYMSVTLVDAPAKLAASKPEVDKVLRGFSYKTGKSYAEFHAGDKVAEYGLVALLAGGAGAAAVKLGLIGWLIKILAKGGKAIIVAVVAIVAAIRKAMARVFGRSE